MSKGERGSLLGGRARGFRSLGGWGRTELANKGVDVAVAEEPGEKEGGTGLGTERRQRERGKGGEEKNLNEPSEDVEEGGAGVRKDEGVTGRVPPDELGVVGVGEEVAELGDERGNNVVRAVLVVGPWARAAVVASVFVARRVGDVTVVRRVPGSAVGCPKYAATQQVLHVTLNTPRPHLARVVPRRRRSGTRHLLLRRRMRDRVRCWGRTATRRAGTAPSTGNRALWRPGTGDGVVLRVRGRGGRRGEAVVLVRDGGVGEGGNGREASVVLARRRGDVVATALILAFVLPRWSEDVVGVEDGAGEEGCKGAEA